MRGKEIIFLSLSAILLAMIALLALPRAASAQCGSSASSCKNCHEVQKQDPVSAKGAWHTAHAFGDFCEFCHAGNVKAKDKAAAHTGMINPLADVKGSCQSCHPNDYMDRAKKYADALGKPIGSASVPPVTNPLSITVASATIAPCGPATPTGGQTIDLNKIYTGTDSGSSLNIGNLILVGLIAAVAFLLMGLVLHYEHPIQRGIAAFRQLLMASTLAATPEGIALNVAQPEINALALRLSSSDAKTVRAVNQLLSDRENGAKVLKALSHLDLNALKELGERDEKALAALMALVREMKS